MYFHTNDPIVLDQMARAMAHAAEQGKSFRIDVTPLGNLKWKCGEGMWTAPHWSTPDAHRDATPGTYHMEVIR